MMSGDTINLREDAAPAPLLSLANLRDDPETARSASLAVPLAPLLIDMAALSQLLARSEASLYRDDAAGRLPAGLKIGASKRWRYAEVAAWVEAGCPDRRAWEAMQAVRKGRK
jgi:predicted DNA-binding transcriptional regulator AlpA